MDLSLRSSFSLGYEDIYRRSMGQFDHGALGERVVCIRSKGLASYSSQGTLQIYHDDSFQTLPQDQHIYEETSSFLTYAFKPLIPSEVPIQTRFNRVLFGPGLLATIGTFRPLSTHYCRG
jgi:hypothetical protein